MRQSIYRSHFSVQFKNFIFGLQLLIVSALIPALSIVEMTRSEKSINNQQEERVTNNQPNNQEAIKNQNVKKTITLG